MRWRVLTMSGFRAIVTGSMPFKPFRQRAMRRWNSKARNADDGLHSRGHGSRPDLHNATELSRVGPGNGPRGTKERPRRGPYRREDHDEQDDVHEF